MIIRSIFSVLCLTLFINVSFCQNIEQNASTEKRLQVAEEHNMYNVPGATIQNVTNDSKFQFDFQITFEMNGNGFSSRQKVWFGEDKYWATSDPNMGDMMVVFDVENKNMILCDQNMKTAQIVNKNEMVSAPNVDVFFERSIKSTESQFKKRKKKNKTIAGYKCSAYEINNNGDIITIWINEKLPINNKNLFSSLLPMMGVSNNDLPNGLIMELETTGVSKLSNMKVLKVDQMKTSIDLSSYTVEERSYKK